MYLLNDHNMVFALVTFICQKMTIIYMDRDLETYKM